MTNNRVYCELCNKLINLELAEEDNRDINTKVQLLFLTDKNDGSGTTPYIDEACLNLCRPCYLKYKGSLKIKGTGAQNHYEYFW